MEREELLYYLNTSDRVEIDHLFSRALQVKLKSKGDKVYLRGLIEMSNKCRKDCLYCGLRRSVAVDRYELGEETVLKEAMFACQARYGSLVIQSGERTDSVFIEKIAHLVRRIKELSEGSLGITLSCGEQTEETYRKWFEAGAHRYLLRIESSNPELYARIHPSDHSFVQRRACLDYLRRSGYMVGTGVMIGLPFQTAEDLADDLLFFKHLPVDMVGMGPYLEQKQTPLYQYRHLLKPQSERLTLAIKMVALLRILMPEINIAATTALQVIDPYGREKAVLAGANVIMPNMTDPDNRENYQIYDNKPGLQDDAEITKSKLEENLAAHGIRIGWSEWGDPPIHEVAE